MNKSFFGSAALWIWELFCHSFTYKVLKTAYLAIAKAWNNCFVVRVFLQDTTAEGSLRKSIFYKIFYLPFWVLSLFALPWGTVICRRIAGSRFFAVLHSSTQNLYAGNTRFMGMLLLSGGGTYMVAYRSTNPMVLSITFVGVVMTFFNENLISALKDSVITPLAKLLFDVDLSFDFVKKDHTTGSSRLYFAILLGVVSGFLAAYYSPLYAAAPMGLLLFAFSLPLAIALTVFAIPFIPTMVAAGLCILCLFILTLKKSVAGDRVWRFGVVEFSIVAFMMVFGFCSLTSTAIFSSMKIFLLCSVLVSFYFVLINAVQSKKQLYTLLLVFIVSAFFVSIYGIIQYIFKLDMDKQVWLDQNMFEDISMRAYSTLENPNVLGEYLLLAIPVCVAFFWSKPTLLQKLGYGSALAVLSVCMILTMSRGCWLGLLLAAAIFITFVDGRYWLLAFVGLLMLPLLLPQSIVARFFSIGNLQDTSSSYRLFIWLGTVRMLRDYWLFGVGPGIDAFNMVYPKYAYDSIIAPHAHNVYLQLLSEMGIVGLTAFILVCIAFFRRLSTKAARLQKKHPDRVMLIAICAGVAAFLFQGAFDYVFYNYRVYLMFWAILGLGICFVYIPNTADAKEHIHPQA